MNGTRLILALTLGALVGLVPCLYAQTETEEKSDGPSKEQIEAFEKDIQAFADKKGLTATRDDQGHLVVKDKYGKFVPLPQDIIPGWLKDLQIKDFEKKIQEFADKEGFKTERDDQGHLLVKDKDGKVVPLPKDLQPKGLGEGPSPEQIAAFEKDIQAFADKNGYTTERDDQGRLVVKDKDGKAVALPKEILPEWLKDLKPLGEIPADTEEDDDEDDTDDNTDSGEKVDTDDDDTDVTTPEDAVKTE